MAWTITVADQAKDEIDASLADKATRVVEDQSRAQAETQVQVDKAREAAVVLAQGVGPADARLRVRIEGHANEVGSTEDVSKEHVTIEIIAS